MISQPAAQGARAAVRMLMWGAALPALLLLLLLPLFVAACGGAHAPAAASPAASPSHRARPAAPAQSKAAAPQPPGDATPWAAMPVPSPVKARVYRSLPAAGRRVALTFDDGGGKTAWYWILRELLAGHAKGTFFPIGEYVGGYARRDARLTLKDHMAIGSHSWSHPDLTAVSAGEVRTQLLRPEAVWWHDFGATPVPYLRPPYGSYNARVLAIAGRLGYSRIILWSVDSRDWSKPGVSAIVRNVLDNVRPGSIILMHTRGQTPKALPFIIAGLHRRHYQMVTVPELFAAAGTG